MGPKEKRSVWSLGECLGGLVSIWARVIACATLGLLIACGGSGDDNGSNESQVAGESEPVSTPSEPESSYGFEDWEFQEVNLKDCERTKSLGKKKSIELETPDFVGAVLFRPMCVTDVKSDEITVTVVNTSVGNTHNFIVEGNEVELVVPAGEEDTVKIELGNEPQIGFQCTIHAPRMYGAFFR